MQLGNLCKETAVQSQVSMSLSAAPQSPLTISLILSRRLWVPEQKEKAESCASARRNSSSLEAIRLQDEARALLAGSLG